MFALMYVSIYFEFAFMTFFAYNLDILHLMDINKAFVGLASIFRTIIICLTYFDENSVNKYLHKHKIIGIMISISITLGCILTDVYLMKYDLINSSMYLIKAIKFAVNVVTYIALMGFCI